MSDIHQTFTDQFNLNFKFFKTVFIHFLLLFLFGWALILLITRDIYLDDKNLISDLLFLYIVIIVLWNSFKAYTIFDGKEPTIASVITRGVVTPEKQIHSPPKYEKSVYRKSSTLIASILVLISYLTIFFIWF